MADSMADVSKRIATLEQKVRSHTALLEAIVTLLSEKGHVSHEDVLVRMKKLMQEKDSGTQSPEKE